MIDSTLLVEHAAQVISQSGVISSLRKDVEIASQPSIFSNDSASRNLHILSTAIFTNIGQLRQLSLDNSNQLKREDSLTSYMHRYLDFSLLATKLKDKYRSEPAITQISFIQGTQLIERIEQTINAIQQEESRLLKQRMQTNQQDLADFKMYSMAMFFLMLGFTFLLVITIGKYFLFNLKRNKRRKGTLSSPTKNLLFKTKRKESGLQNYPLRIKNWSFKMKKKKKELKSSSFPILQKLPNAKKMKSILGTWLPLWNPLMMQLSANPWMEL